MTDPTGPEPSVPAGAEPAVPAEPEPAVASGPQPAVVPLRRRLLALLAVAAARPLATTRPQRIRAVLRLVRRGAAPATRQQAAAARQAVVTVSPRCAAGRSCLHRSLATALLCRAWGTWPTWCTGVRTDPFRAHAWVAVGSEPVGEPAHERGYTPVITVPPLPPTGNRP
ncbi:lasso peptide biosynthesis B2 protein [Streptomyces tricolor]|uniref:lasso peptide biosynthesis B2 protein n=1 Tax=Streptomyces tricolor TaxID=68277 RepID=UPI003D74C8A8